MTSITDEIINRYAKMTNEDEIQLIIDDSEPPSAFLVMACKEIVKLRTDIAALQEQLRIVRSERFHASAFLDCSQDLHASRVAYDELDSINILLNQKIAKYELVMRDIIEYRPGALYVCDIQNMLSEALK